MLSLTIRASALALLVSGSALASDFAGVPVAPVSLKAADGTALTVSANKKYQGRPDGFFKMYLTNVEVNIARSGSTASVVFVADCTNYNGQPYAMSVTCDAKASGTGLVARLDGSCRKNADNAGFAFQGKDWYLSGRDGYYSAHSCKPSIAISVDGQWLQDPVTRGSNFGLSLDSGYTPEADEGFRG